MYDCMCVCVVNCMSCCHYGVIRKKEAVEGTTTAHNNNNNNNNTTIRHFDSEIIFLVFNPGDLYYMGYEHDNWDPA